MGSLDGRLGKCWVLEAVGGSWWVTGLGAGFVGELGGYVELSYCRQRERAGTAGLVMPMPFRLFPLQPGEMDLPRVGPTLLSALQLPASLMQLGQHFNREIPCVMSRVHLCLTLQ